MVEQILGVEVNVSLIGMLIVHSSLLVPHIGDLLNLMMIMIPTTVPQFPSMEE